MEAAIYGRFSTDKQDSRSIEDQARRCRAFAAERGLRVVGAYADAAMSGTHTDRRDLQRLLADADARRFQSLLVDDVSRLNCDLGDVWNLVFSRFALAGVEVIDVSSGIGSDNPNARMVFG